MVDGAVPPEPVGLTDETRERLRANGRLRARAQRDRARAKAELGPLLVQAVTEGATVAEAARLAGISREVASLTIRETEGRVFAE